MKKTSILAMLLSFALLASCGSNSAVPGKDPGDSVSSTPSVSESGSVSAEVTLTDPSELFTDRDREGTYEEKGSAVITLNGNSASCSSDAVKIDGSTVTITDEGTYILSGTLSDGMIIVNADKTDKTQLVLDGVSISSSTSAPIYILQADKVFLTLAEGSVNTLSNGGTFTAVDENNIDSVIFSKEDLTLNGGGKLTITSPAGHGIVSKDELTVTGGTYEIISASHGISGKDNVCVAGGTFTISSGKDGIQAEHDEDAALGFLYIEGGSFTISAEGDGLSASSYIQIEDGTFDLVTGGGSVNAQQQTSSDWGNFGGGGMGGGNRGGPGGGGMGGGPGGNPGEVPAGAPGDMPDGNPGEMPSGDPGQMPSGDPGDIPEGETPGGGFGQLGGGDGFGELGTETDSTSIKGLKASALLLINGGTFTIDSADDAVHSNGDLTVNGGTFDIASGDDGFHADSALVVTAGTISISESYEGLEGQTIDLTGGDVTLVASDDGLNAAGGTDQSGFGGMRGGDMFAADDSCYINISGGTLYMQASGDGIDSNGSLTISGGVITICGPNSGDTAVLDYASTGTISGGTFIGTGAYMMAQTFSASEGQGVIAVSVGSQSAGTVVTLTDSEGNIIVEHTPELPFAIVILSTPDVVKGETYTVTVGTTSGEFAAS